MTSRVHAPSRIIAPVTLDAGSIEAVDAAGALAASLDAELILLGITPLAPPDAIRQDGLEMGGLSAGAETQGIVDRLVAEQLEECAERLSARVRARRMTAWGPVGPVLVNAARAEGADLIVLAIRRESELLHLVDDHADRHVLHHSDVPVLIVPT
jgi:nucleotide-binding universal stress UspA family protein